MCKHCQKLVEDVAHKQTVHDFMQVLTVGINRKLAEDGKVTRVTADEIEFYATMASKEPEDQRIPRPMLPSVLKLLYRDLMESMQ